MKLIPKKWDNLTVMVDEDLLNRAKQLIREHGIVQSTPVVEALEREFGYPPCSSDVSRAWVIAGRELHEESSSK